MSDDVTKAQSPDETLTNETESEREGSAVTSTDTLDPDGVQAKALDKFNQINKPTDRATAENLAKLSGQINSAEVQIATTPVYQGTAHPEHQTYGVLGVPLAALTHDYDEDRLVVAQATVKTKEESPEVKQHNESIKEISEALAGSAEHKAEEKTEDWLNEQAGN